jgi:hypothetical protein
MPDRDASTPLLGQEVRAEEGIITVNQGPQRYVRYIIFPAQTRCSSSIQPGEAHGARQ